MKAVVSLVIKYAPEPCFVVDTTEIAEIFKLSSCSMTP